MQFDKERLRDICKNSVLSSYSNVVQSMLKNVRVSSCSATPVGIVVVRGDCDLETCRLYIDRLQEVSIYSFFLYQSIWSCQSIISKAKYLLADYYTSLYNQQNKTDIILQLCWLINLIYVIRVTSCYVLLGIVKVIVHPQIF